jgi:hypothetical protein
VKSRRLVRVLVVVLGLAAAACGSATNQPASEARSSFLHRLHIVTQIASTVPANGDVNPYGLAVVPTSAGRLVAGDTLVSNFNDKRNVQGTGTTIVEISPSGSTQLFARISSLPAGQDCPAGIGLTLALGILPGGWVVVGSLPTRSGGALQLLQPVGCLIVLNSQGTPVETITNKDIVGPWDLSLTSSATSATIFVANALGETIISAPGEPVAGTATVLRLDLHLSATSPPTLTSTTIIGKDYPWMANQAALVLAPTGMALGHDGTLYVDDAQTDSISAIPRALTRSTALAAAATTLSSGGGLDAPEGMVLVADGDLIVVNGNNGNAVEITPAGKQIATQALVKNGAGDLIGLTTNKAGNGILFSNDGTNALDLYHG